MKGRFEQHVEDVSCGSSWRAPSIGFVGILSSGRGFSTAHNNACHYLNATMKCWRRRESKPASH